MKVWRSGTSVHPPRATARTSSREGSTSSPAPSAATAIQHLERIRQGQAPRVHEHVEVVEHVGGLLAYALVGLLAGGARHLLGLLLHLRADQAGVGQQRG